MSLGRALDSLARSIEEVGLISPLLLRPGGERFQLICGSRRRQALRQSGRREFAALILPAEADDRTALLLALEDNRTGRGFNEGEKVLALQHLSRFFSREELLRKFLPLLDLPPKEEYLDRYLSLFELNPGGWEALASGDLDAETGEELVKMNPDDRAAVLDLIERLRPGRNKRRQMVSLLMEIGRRESLSFREIIAAPEIREILDAEHLNRPQKEQSVRSALARQRYPRLSELESRQAALLKNLDLPEGMRLEPPPNFEGLDFTFHLSFAGLSALRAESERLGDLLNRPDLAELLDLG